MEDRIRTQFLSAVVLVVVFAAGGLVGAAVAGSDGDGDAEDPSVALTAPEEGREEEPERERNRRQWMFERAGATEAQAERILSEFRPWWEQKLDSLWDDSTVQALDDRADSLRDEYRAARRELEAYYDPRRDSIIDSARVLIRGVLDPQAQLVYDSLVAERNRRDRDGGGRHP